MTNGISPAHGAASRTAAVARRLVTFAMTATVLSLAGCGDSGDSSDDSGTDASHTGRRASAADPAWHGDNGHRTIGSWAPAATACREQLRD